jgi:hypothetical protein
MEILVTSYLRVIGNEEATKLQSRAVGNEFIFKFGRQKK